MLTDGHTTAGRPDVQSENTMPPKWKSYTNCHLPSLQYGSSVAHPVIGE